MKNIKYENLYESKNFSNDVNGAICNLAKENKDLIKIYKIGSSIEDTPIIALNIGFGKIKILINGTHHARELLSTILLLDQIKYIVYLYNSNLKINNIDVKELLDYITFVFVPLVNPDGADLVLNGKSFMTSLYKDAFYMQREQFGSWKSNARGVDLNRNYPTKYPTKNMVDVPGAKGYTGDYYLSEPETCALRDLSEYCLFEGSISYHSSGEEIYWEYNQSKEEKERDLKIARIISNQTGYKLIEEERPNRGNGYKDWFIENYNKPALTIEISPYVGERKIPIKYYPQIFEKNKEIPIIFGNEILKNL